MHKRLTKTAGYLNDLWKFNGSIWTWISGSNRSEERGNYGTNGVPSSENVPGARFKTDSWMDSRNYLWIFGGEGFDSQATSGLLNDLWMFNGVNWTWISGSNTINNYPNYGDAGVPDSANVPGSKIFPTMWGDRWNQIWIFGGYGYVYWPPYPST
jgi:hypothetical protein